MAMTMSYHQLWAYLCSLEKKTLTIEAGGYMPLTIVKCHCADEYDCAECLEEGESLEGFLIFFTFGWCPSLYQGQFINCFYGNEETAFHTLWPCSNSSICTSPPAPLPKYTQSTNDYVQSLLNNE
ncbi:unnamed protein product [Meganyctiphanes norvegica]|uniref:Uncharacterized protein n=1 Tax=Meganyctiphanes norvegica TaxID=48144 RepID=A0AAV2R8Q1_MEGNR